MLAMREVSIRPSSAALTAPADGPKSSAAAMLNVSEIEKLIGIAGMRSMGRPLATVRATRMSHCRPTGCLTRSNTEYAAMATPNRMMPRTYTLTVWRRDRRLCFTLGIGESGPGPPRSYRRQEQRAVVPNHAKTCQPGPGRQSQRCVLVRFVNKPSIKIVGVEVDADAAHSLHVLGAHRSDAVLVLEHTFDDQKRLFDDDEPIACEEIRTHDDVGDAGLVLEREKDEAFRRPWALTRDDHPGDAHAAALPPRSQIRRAQDTAHRELVAAERHGMAADRETRACVIGNQALGLGHRPEGTLGLGVSPRPRV